MKPERPSFSVVAERRFRLAGKAIIERHNIEACFATSRDACPSRFPAALASLGFG